MNKTIDADKYPDEIFLLDDGEGISWCDCAAPGQNMDPDDAVKYIRADADMDLDKLVSGHPAAEAELEQLRSRVGYLQDVLSQVAEKLKVHFETGLEEPLEDVEPLIEALTQSTEAVE